MLNVGRRKMNFQELCELAEKELRLGIPDERLIERALTEADGVAAHAQQIYWRLRATALQKEEDARIGELVAQLEDRERRLRSRKERYRWIWAIACMTGLVGAALFPSFAFRAIGKAGPSFFVFFILSVASLALAVLAFTASRYHTHTE
jgi:hypothetical protein